MSKITEMDEKAERVCLTNIAFEYSFGDIVYLKTDVNQLPRMVIGYFITPELTQYKLICSTEESYHYGFEITYKNGYSLSVDLESEEV